MRYVATLKIYMDNGLSIEKLIYKIKNAKDVIANGVCSGDIIDLKGVGQVEIYSTDKNEENGVVSLLIVGGIIEV